MRRLVRGARGLAVILSRWSRRQALDDELVEKHCDSRSPIEPGQELVGKYRIERVLGSGAMGVVVEAHHLELEQSVAVKFLYPECARANDGAERFRREARAAARIKSDHVARVLDMGTLEEGGAPFIVMEYLRGKDLSAELEERGWLPVGEAVTYVLEACEAVAEAHRHGIVHRDLKPANLFLAEQERGGRMVKVLDFGISKMTVNGHQPSLTDTSALMGSPAYMSPEQLESSRNVDGRADIWSLGVILHELLMGEVPFEGESMPQLVRSILGGQRSSLTERNASLAELDAVVAKCLRLPREERFDDVPALCEALQPFRDWRGGDWAPPNQDSAVADSGAAAQLGGTVPEPAIAEEPASSELAAGAVPARDVTDSRGFDDRSRSESTRSTGGEQQNGLRSAWGNTRDDGERSWAARALPFGLVAAVAVALYFLLVDRPVARRLDAPRPPAKGALQSAVESDRARPALEVAKQASSPAPDAPPLSPSEAADPATTATPEPPAASTDPEEPATTAVPALVPDSKAKSSRRSRRVRRRKKASSASKTQRASRGQESPAPPAPSSPASVASTPERAAAGGPEPALGGSEPAEGTPPLPLPDFGGRE